MYENMHSACKRLAAVCKERGGCERSVKVKSCHCDYIEYSLIVTNVLHLQNESQINIPTSQSKYFECHTAESAPHCEQHGVVKCAEAIELLVSPT
jgi:hypothetical protein